MVPIYFYSIEIVFRFAYVFASFVLCTIVSIYNINWLLLFVTYPFLQFFAKKFIITHVTDFIDVIWVLVCSISLLFILPLVFYQSLNFFKSSWYTYQAKIVKKLFYWLWTSVNVLVVLCYLIILPSIINFLTYWEKLEQSNSILTIETEFRILNFVYWVLHFQYSFIFFISSYLFVVALLWSLLEFTRTYFVVKLYRKQLSFINLLFLFVLAPSDISLQFLLIFFVIIFYEFVFLFVCYKISNSD
uniref:SecY n=1 Tax=Polyopes lancifolius TaxID=194517 RepID=A0A891T7G5_9FLOR|nr:SecY [Polyopes lancifolius]QRM91074.1 SecY [Polyopes lancifolius]